MFKFGSIFLACVCSLMLKMIGLIYKHVYDGSKSSLAEEKGSNFSENRSQVEEKAVSQNSNVVFADEKESFDLQKKDSFLSRERECSVSLQSGLVSKHSKCQFFSGENVSGFLEEAKTVKFVVQEMFVESDNQCIGAEIMGLEQNLDDFDEEAEVSPFYFKLFDASLFTNDRETGANLPEREEIGEKCFHHEEADDNEENPEVDFAYEEDQLIKSSHFSDQESDADDKDDEILIIPPKIEKIDSENWMSSFLDQNHYNESSEDHENEDAIDIQTTKNSSEEDEFIELEPRSLKLSHLERESGDSSPSSSADATEEHQKCRDSDEDEAEDEADVLSQHQHLVEQMKMELKNCRTRGLPTISEESENPKIIEEDLRPLKIDHKIGYKDVIKGIHNFYKSYAEKMRKLDILNYQTSHAIGFLRLKESEVFRAGKKRSNSLLPKILAGKVRRVYAADPMHKSIDEMQRDLEVVYVGQLCLSWEILWWLDARTRELLEYEGEGRGSNNSYNRAAEEFQQFQVLVQRFMEDELFQGRRHDNYVKSRCLIRSLLQVPTIKDDCLKTTTKEMREETDKITLEMLVEIITGTMVIFQEFVLADKKATSSSLTTKVDVRESGSSELLSDVICGLEKKDKRMKEQMRRQNCIVKKLKKQQRRIMDREMLAAQVDLRLIWRVLNMERLSEDRLVWCKKKLSNINLVGRKVRREACFLLFPC